MIEVGEYVRTNYGRICKVINNDHFMPRYLECENEMLIDRTDIVKHSKFLSEVIEVGDYVNGNKVVQTYKDSKKQDEIYLEVVVSSIIIKEPLTDYIEEDRIKTMLTKEQYERNCYKVEE